MFIKGLLGYLTKWTPNWIVYQMMIRVYVESLNSLKNEVKLLSNKIIAYHLQSGMGDEEFCQKINEDEDY